MLPPEPIQPTASLPALFLACLKIGMLSFGGGLSGWLYREFVEQQGWITDEDFASSLAISQMLPGANVVNLVICMGEQLRGPPGAAACIAGFLVGPFFGVIALSALVDTMMGATWLQSVLDGIAYTAIGLLLIICWRGIGRVRNLPSQLSMIAAVAIAVGILKWPLLLVVAVAAPLNILLAWRRVGRNE